jgi:hypothetical protein
MSSEYLYATSTHPETLPYPVVTISLSDIRNSSSSKSNDEVFQEVLGKLDPYVGAEYVLVVLAAESIPMVDGNEDSVTMKERRRSDPGLGWWLSKWSGLPHRSVRSVQIRKEVLMVDVERTSRDLYVLYCSLLKLGEYLLMQQYIVHPSPFTRSTSFSSLSCYHNCADG